VLKIDNAAVRNKQVERLNTVRAKRDNEACQRCLDALTKAAESGEGNLLELSVKAA